MERYNNILCATHSELTNGIVSKSLLDWWSSNGKVERVRRGGRGREALFSVDSLPVKYKMEVYRRYPDLKLKAVSKPFMESIVPDGAAEAFFQDFLLPDGRHLEDSKQREYANNAAILNTYRTLLERAASARARHGSKRINKQDFWKRASKALTTLADQYPNSLPAYPSRLQEKYNEYVRKGYACLISGKFQNRNAAKVDLDVQENIIIQLLADPRNLSNAQIRDLYNVLAKTMSWPEITSKPVEVIQKKYTLITSGGRLGETRFRNEVSMQVNVDGVSVKSEHQPKEDGFGHAVDIYPYVNGRVDVNDAQSLRVIADHIKAVAASLGIAIEWGGDWKMRDMPHFQLR